MALKEDGVNFVLCPKQGNKIEGFPKQGMYLKLMSIAFNLVFFFLKC